jgi:hypothetical protein
LGGVEVDERTLVYFGKEDKLIQNLDLPIEKN